VNRVGWTEHGVMGAAAVCGGVERADGAEDCRVPECEWAVQVADATDGGDGTGAEDVSAGGGFLRIPGWGESAGYDRGASGIVCGGGEDCGVAGVKVAGVDRPAGASEKVNLEGFKTETVGIYTLTDIREEFTEAGADPRDTFVGPNFGGCEGAGRFAAGDGSGSG